MSYGYKKKVNLPYRQAVERTKEELKKGGFGVLTEIDVKATLKKKLDVDYDNYVIIGACNPPFAYRALQSERDIGLLLPCNVIVYEEDGASMVSIVDPISMLGVVDSPELKPVADEARARLGRVAKALGG
jgi:uncharacterized protein (DUF302 family)